MNKYYTNIFRLGNRLFVREVRNGKRRKYKTEYRPTLYVPSNKKTGKFRSPEGQPVEPIQPGTMGECYQFIQKYKDVDNFRIYGNTAYEYAYLNEEYPGPLNYKLSEMVLCNLDIEVEKTKDGYSEAKDALNRVTAITVKTSVDDVFHVFAYHAFDQDEYNAAHPDSTIAYHHCKDEIDLLERFLDLWEMIEPDIITGWNIRLYDVPYLVNRITRVISEEAAKRLSPWGIVKESTVSIFDQPQIVFDLVGINILDYFLIYKKNVLEPRESYRLDYISQVELGEQKVDYGEYNDLQDLYERNFKKFIEYNIHDVRLVDRIEAKRKLIELQLIVAFHAKINFVDVLSQVRTWDTNICNYLLSQGVVVPQKSHTDKDAQFVGAFVMKPIPGMYQWVASFDVQSLYPTIMRTLNMGMESKLELRDLTPEMRQYQNYINSSLMISDEDGKLTVSPAAIVNGLTDEFIEHLREHDVTVAANGVFYRRDPKSFYSILIEDLFTSRLEYKAQMKKAAKELSTCTDPIRKAELENDKSNYDLKQHSTKVLLNSLYGAMGNQYFRFFDLKNAEAVTTTGQFLIQFVGQGLDLYLNQMMRTTGKRFVVYSDTDSVYITLQDVVDKYYKDKTLAQKVDYVDKLCKEAIQPEINRMFRLLTDRYLNGVGEYLLMNREVIGDKGIWTAKKRYLINVRDKEGIRKHPAELKYMGVEIAKSSIPKFCRESMKQAVRIVMEEDQETLFKFVAETKATFKSMAIEDVSFPRGVNGLGKYGNRNTVFIKGTPFHTKGALVYNHLLETTGMGNKYQRIRDGEKMKFFYIMEPNPTQCNAMAFLTKFPTEFGMDKYIDWEMQWEKSFIEPLKLILNAIAWDAEPRASLDFMFGDDDEEVVTAAVVDPDDDLEEWELLQKEFPDLG